MSSDDDGWIDRTTSDPEFADAVWSGTAPLDGAPSWYPQFSRLVNAAGTPRVPDDDEVGRRDAAWADVSRRTRRTRRRRLVVAGAVALGAALAAGGAAAASDGGLRNLPFLGWEAGGDAREPDAPGLVDGVSPAGAGTQSSMSGPEPVAERAVPPGHARTDGPPTACQPDLAPSPGCSERSERGRGRGAGRSATPPRTPPGTPPGQAADVRPVDDDAGGPPPWSQRPDNPPAP